MSQQGSFESLYLLSPIPFELELGELVAVNAVGEFGGRSGMLDTGSAPCRSLARSS